MFNLHQQPETFLCILLGMTFAQDFLIGCDMTLSKTIIPTLTDQMLIFVAKKKYLVKQVMWRSEMICGQATTCFLVFNPDDNRFYIVKDCWISRGHKPTEVYFLNKAKWHNVPYVPELLSMEVVMINGYDICSLNWGAIDSIEDCVHICIVFKDYGVPITQFELQAELSMVFANCIEGA